MSSKWNNASQSVGRYLQVQRGMQQRGSKVAPEPNAILPAVQQETESTSFMTDHDDDDDRVDDFSRGIQPSKAELLQGWDNIEQELQRGFDELDSMTVTDDGQLMVNGQLDIPKKSGLDAAIDSSSSSEDDTQDAPKEFSSNSEKYQLMVLHKKYQLAMKQLEASKIKLNRYQDRRKVMKDQLQEYQVQLTTQHDKLNDLEAALEKQMLTNATQLKENNRPRRRDTTAEWNKQRQEAIKQLISGTNEENADMIVVKSSTKRNRTIEKVRNYLRKWYPFSADIQVIEARYGTSVASYFKFQRWIVLTYILLLIPTILHILSHIYDLQLRTPAYQDWKLYRGFAPDFIMIHTYTESEAVGYAGVLSMNCIILLWTTISKWIKEDRLLKATEIIDQGSGNKYKFARVALNAWDFSTKSAPQVLDFKRSIAGQIRVTMHEDLADERLKYRTSAETYTLYFRRFTGFTIYTSLQLTGWYVIVFLTTISADLEEKLKSSAPILAPYAALSVPSAVAMINAALPAIIIQITSLERWDDAGFGVKAMVTRLFLSRISNILIQLFSYSMLLNPYFFTSSEDFLSIVPSSVRVDVQKEYSAYNSTSKLGYTCRAEQVGYGLLTLMIAEFVFAKLILIGLPLLDLLIARVFKKPYVKEEFLVAQKMVDLLYYQTLVLLVVPLSPGTLIGCFPLMLLNFKYDKWILFKYQRKPMVPWNAKDSGNFFIKFYFTTVVIFLYFNHFFMNNQEFPKSCPLQDQLNDGTKLCLSNTYNNSTELCTLNPSHPRSSFFQSNNTGIYVHCPIGYPKCMCTNTLACGPFTTADNGYSLLQTYFQGNSYSKSIFTSITDNVLILWILLLFFALAYFFQRNSVLVLRYSNAEQMQDMAAEIENLRKKLTSQQRKFQVQQQLQNSVSIPT